MTQLLRASDAQVMPASSAYFTGTVFQSVLAAPVDGNGTQVVRVTFAPTARTTWHTHPAGQILMVESGLCLFQSWGGPILEMTMGDTIIIPPGEKHWHGSSPNTVMTHIAIQPMVDGVAAVWLELVTPEQYSNTA